MNNYSCSGHHISDMYPICHLVYSLHTVSSVLYFKYGVIIV